MNSFQASLANQLITEGRGQFRFAGAYVACEDKQRRTSGKDIERRYSATMVLLAPCFQKVGSEKR